MRPSEPRQGYCIEGRYLLNEEIGRGGHGVVYRALDIETGSTVAVKVLKDSVSEDSEYAIRLWREAQSMKALWGTSVVRVYRFGYDESGAVYMVMEMLEGETLEERVDDLACFGDRMSPVEMLTILDPVARALEAAHLKGIIHRDLKPSNIFLLSDAVGGGVRLMDFGLAKKVGSQELTEAGMIAGSPSYIAPEMWRAKGFDHRIDVYSMGAIVFRVLGGVVPFESNSTIDLLRKVTGAERPKLSPLRPDLSPEIDAWVEQVLAILPDERFPYVSSMWTELIRILMDGETASARRVRAIFSRPDPAT